MMLQARALIQHLTGSVDTVAGCVWERPADSPLGRGFGVVMGYARSPERTH